MNCAGIGPSARILSKKGPHDLALFRKGVDVEVNPQYGADSSGVAGKTDASLSLAVSPYAKQARSAQPDSHWVSALPADQRCG